MSNAEILAVGSLVAERYRIDEALPSDGGLYRATDLRLDRDVTLRALPLPRSEADRARAAELAALAARLEHPNVAPVLDVGVDAGLDLQYAVTEALQGGTLAALLAQRGAPPLPLATRIVQDAAAGMGAAHAAGLVHGDLSPGALFLVRDEHGRLRARVLGLGLWSGALPPSRPAARYAAPERLRRTPGVSAAADVFSVGVMAYEVLAGLPADWNTRLIAMARGQAVDVPSPTDARQELPSRVAEAITRALAPDPAQRWPNGAELADALTVVIPVPRIVASPAPAAEPEAPAVVAEAPTAPAAEPPAAKVTAPEPVKAAEPVAEAPAAKTPKTPRGAPARPTVLEATDLRDVLYIPPTLETAPRREPARPAASAKPEAHAAASVEAPRAEAPAAEAPTSEITKAEAPAPVEAPKPEQRAEPVAEITLEPAAPAPVFAPRAAAPVPAPSAADSATGEKVEAVTVPLSAPAAVGWAPYGEAAAAEPAPPVSVERRRRGFGGKPPSTEGTKPNRRVMMIGGGVVGVLLLGAVAFAALRGGGAADGLATRSLAAADRPAAPAAAQPGTPPLSEAAQPQLTDSAAPAVAVAAPAVTDDPAKAEELRKLEEKRRLDLARRDSLRRANEAARAAQTAQAQLPVAPPVAPPPAPTPARPVESRPVQPQVAARESAPQPIAPAPPPAPVVSRVDANRTYGPGEVDSPPALTNGGDVQRAMVRAYASPIVQRPAGQATVNFVVLPNGRVDPASITVAEASDATFASAVRQAIRQARFNPARVDGQIVKARASLPLAWSP